MQGRDQQAQGKLERPSAEREHDTLSKMDVTKLSPSPRPPTPAVKGADKVQQVKEDAGALRLAMGDGDVEMEKQRDLDSLLQVNHKGATDKHRFNTVGHQKRNRQKLVYFTTERKGQGKSRAALKQVLFYQGLSDKTLTTEERSLDSLNEVLHSYRVPDLRDWKTQEGCGVPGLPLEDSWTDLVHSHLTMEKTERHQQEALWELIHTEVSYMYKLTIVTELVMGALNHLHRHGFLLEVTLDHLFSNMPSVLSAHRHFWKEVLVPMLEEVRETGAPFDPVRLEQGCMQFQERFSAYFQYCWEEERIVEFARQLMDTSPQFRSYISWVESHPSCGRMRLGDMQAKPHQRITKYPLLLAAVLKTTVDHKSQYTVRKMLSSVNSFLDSINEYMKLKDEELALSLIAQRVEGYEVVEAISEEIEKHIRDFSYFDLTGPIRGGGARDIRKLLLEETLRIRERREGKMEVVVLLFSDVLLLTKAQRKTEKLKVIRPPLALERLGCVALKDDCSFVLIEIGELGCAVNVYVVVAPNPESRSQWINSIQETQASLRAMREREKIQSLGRFFHADAQAEIPVIPSTAETSYMLENNVEEPRDPSEIGSLLSSNLREENSSTQSDNEKSSLQEVERKHLLRPRQNRDIKITGKSFLFSESEQENFESVKRSVKKLHGFNYIEMSELKRGSDSSQSKPYEIILHGANERRATWNNSRNASSNLNKLFTQQTDSTKTHSSSSNSLNVDTESDLESSSSQSEYRCVLYDKNQDLENESSNREPSRDFSVSQSGDPWRFPRKLKSPQLRKRRFLAQHGLLTQTHNKSSLGAGISGPISSSGFISEDSQMLGWSLLSPEQRCDPQSARSLGTIKKSQGISRPSSAQSASPVTQTFPAAKLPNQEGGKNSQKMPRLKSQRSLSVPEIEPQNGQGPGISPAWSDSSISIYYQTKLSPRVQNPSLETILKRATERERDKQKQTNKPEWRKHTVLDCLNSLTASPPSYPSDEKKEILTKPWKLLGTDRKQKKEDDANGGLKYSFFYGDSASVDWTGWCFDDDEVMFFLDPDSSGSLADPSRTPASVNLSKHLEDQQSSEV